MASVAARRHRNLTVTANLAEADVGDAKLLAERVDWRFPDALVELLAGEGDGRYDCRKTSGEYTRPFEDSAMPMLFVANGFSTESLVSARTKAFRC